MTPMTLVRNQAEYDRIEAQAMDFVREHGGRARLAEEAEILADGPGTFVAALAGFGIARANMLLLREELEATNDTDH